LPNRELGHTYGLDRRRPGGGLETEDVVTIRGRESPSSSEFIREVDEAVRREQWLKLWQRYGSYVIAAALAVVIGAAVGVGWRSWQHNQRLDEARRYAEAQQLLREAKPAEAASAFAALAEDSSGGYRVLARLRAAEAQAQAADRAAAMATLDELASDDGAASVYRSLAELLKAQQEFAEAEEPAVAELEPLTGSGAPWRYSALELRALAQMQGGDIAAARQTLDDLLEDPSTPPDLARRAAELLAFLGGPPAPAAGDEGAITEAE
jgi:hypothetical protein